MPRISGVYQLPPSYRAVSGETIRVEQHNPPLEDIAEALTGSLPRDGSAPMTADLKMGGNRITNVAAATTSTDAARFDQVEGKIAGPASATADAVPVFDGTTGKLIKDSAKLLPTGDIVGTTDTQTLSNKTLTTPLVNVGSDAPGDLYQRNAAGTGFERIPVGASGTALVSDGTKWGAGAVGGKPFRVVDQKTTGTNGGTFTAGAWQVRDLNEVQIAHPDVSVASNVVTFASGIWLVNATGPAFGITSHRNRIATTGGTVLRYSASISAQSDQPDNQDAPVYDAIVDASAGAVSINLSSYSSGNSRTGDGFGQATNTPGVPEIYSQLSALKIG